MIRTVADFLEALMIKERAIFPEYDDIQHPGLFGDMYEGLAKALMGRALFDGMDLRVASGKIRNSQGSLSGQIDCMVVIGEGEPIPFTQHCIYPVQKVLMIVEVKKTLYGAKLKEAMELFRHFSKEVAEVGQSNVNLLNDAWRSLFKRNLPSPEDVTRLPFHEEMIYHSLLVEAVLPLRVVFGFEGYVDEYGLREGFVSYLDEIFGQPPEARPRFNINSFPNLIVCRKASLIKLDGMPYPGMVDEQGYWWWLGSRKSEPFHSLLELLWTRLDFKFKIGPAIFGEDLEMEAINPLVGAKAVDLGNRGGWQYEYRQISRDELERGGDKQEWHPPSLSKSEFVLLTTLLKKGTLDLSDKALIDFLFKEGETVESISKSLNQKNLAAAVGPNLTIITDQCDCMMLADGRFVAAENKSGRLTRYAMKVAKETKTREVNEPAASIAAAAATEIVPSASKDPGSCPNGPPS